MKSKYSRVQPPELVFLLEFFIVEARVCVAIDLTRLLNHGLCPKRFLIFIYWIVISNPEFYQQFIQILQPVKLCKTHH